MKPYSLFLIAVACAVLSLSCAKDNSTPTGNEQAKPLQGMWLNYWSGPQPIRLILGVKYYAVRFTKPADWTALTVDSVAIVSASGGSTIKLSFWATTRVDNQIILPSDPPTQSSSKTVAQGLNNWGVTGEQWKTNSAEFFVGLEQGAAMTLCSDGQAQPEVRSYRCYSGSNWEKELGMASNYCIGVYVTQTN